MTVLSSIVLFFVAQAGAVSGVVRDAAGTPQAGVRVAAVAILPPDEAKTADVLVSIGKTDETGRYTLEIPQGRYYIVAGRVSRPLYYPMLQAPDRPRPFRSHPVQKQPAWISRFSN